METMDPCCCCLLNSPYKNLKTPYKEDGINEIFLNMLEECFQIYLTLDDDDDDGCGICEECVGRLRDASDFKQQVQRSQAELRTRRQRALHVKDEPLPETADESGACDWSVSYEERVKSELDEENGTSAGMLHEEPVKSEVQEEDWSHEMLHEEPVKSEVDDEDEPSAEMLFPLPGLSGAEALRVSARARGQLAMTFSVSLERLRGGERRQ